jgi:tellurite resistance protein TerC
VSTSIWFWIAFHVGVFLAVVIDLAQFKHRGRELSMRAAAQRSVLWVLLSLGFNCVVWYLKGADSAIDFLTGYLIEYSLSVDNIFVFVLIFSHFRVSGKAQHRVLVWGILGALVMRGVMIGLGVALVSSFHWILYFFGVFLVITAFRMFFGKTSDTDFGDTWWMKMTQKMIPVTRDFYGEHFKVKINGRYMLTPLALVLIVIDLMDLVFAVDSIPAVFAITQDQFIVYTSNICAIVGLRSLYFLLAKLMNRFIYLKTGLAIVLAFVGTKMVLADILHLPNWLSLLVIVVILSVTITISMIVTKHRAGNGQPKPP